MKAAVGFLWLALLDLWIAHVIDNRYRRRLPAGRASVTARRAVAVIGRRIGSWILIILTGEALVAISYLGLVASESIIFNYSFLYDRPPKGSGAALWAVVGDLAFVVAACGVAYMVYGWMLRFAVDSRSGARGPMASLAGVRRPLLRDLWWGMPLSAVTTLATITVVGAAMVPPVLNIALRRIDRTRPTSSRSPVWTVFPYAAAAALTFLAGASAISSASDRVHLSGLEVGLLITCGWLLLTLGGLSAAFLATLGTMGSVTDIAP